MTAETARPLFLAIDQGSHATRAAAFAPDGEAVASAQVPVESRTIGPDRVEQDGDEIVRSVREAVVTVAGMLGARRGDVARAGLATQRSSIICWDRDGGEALSAVLSWQDRRAAAWLRRLGDKADDIHARTGLVLSPHYGASKMRWCLDHLPDLAAPRKRASLAIGPLASFVLHRLLATRPFVCDPANASRTQLWDYRDRDWSPELLALYGVPRAVLPDCVPSRYDYGALDTGAGRKTPLTVATGDQPAALYAFGAPGADTVFANIGTGAFALRVTGRRPAAHDRLLQSVVYADTDQARYAVEGTVNGAGSAVAWIAGETGLNLDDVLRQLPDWLDKEHDRTPLFLNGVSGLGSPYWVADFPSRFIGATQAPWPRIVAVVESIAFLLAVNIEEIAALGPSRPKRVIATGGLARLDGLCRRLAALTGLTVERPGVDDATARGLAYLVAGQPRAWLAGKRDRFPPAEAPALTRRYRRWRAAMEAAVTRARRHMAATRTR